MIEINKENSAIFFSVAVLMVRLHVSCSQETVNASIIDYQADRKVA